MSPRRNRRGRFVFGTGTSQLDRRFLRNRTLMAEKRWEKPMAEKFDPAPHDKHAAHPREAARADRQMHEDLKAGLVGTFPASDPVSAAQPSKSRHDDDSAPTL